MRGAGMKLRESIAITEQKLAMLNSRGWQCEVCGKAVTLESCQLGHIIPKYKYLVKRYGKAVIHHPLNMKIVCGNTCNDAVMRKPATNPIYTDELIALIRSKL